MPERDAMMGSYGSSGTRDADGADTPLDPGAQPDRSKLPDWRDLLELRRFNEAKKAYLVAKYAASGVAALDQGPTDDVTRAALTALADIEDLLRERRYKKAIERLSRLESRPTLAPWHALEADLETLLKVGTALDRRDAEEALSRLGPLEATWFRAEALTLQGTAQIYQGETATAQQSFLDALETDPDHYRALTNLGNLALEEGEIDEAIGRYQRAIEINDEFANAHHNLGVALRRKGHVAKSVRELRRAQRLAYRQDAAQARESFTGGLKAQRARPVLKWVLWVAVGAVVWWVLRSRGVL